MGSLFFHDDDDDDDGNGDAFLVRDRLYS